MFKQQMKQFMIDKKHAIVGAVAAGCTAATSAFAALDAGTTTAISGAAADVVTAIGLMTGVAVTIWSAKKVMHLFGR